MQGKDSGKPETWMLTYFGFKGPKVWGSRQSKEKATQPICYTGDYLDQEVQEEHVEVRRSSVRRRNFDATKISRIIPAVTTTILISLCEAKREEEGRSQGPSSTFMMFVIAGFMGNDIAAAVFQRNR